MPEPTTGSSSGEEIRRMLDAADADVRKVIQEVTRIERATLHQRHRNKSAVSKQIVDGIRRSVK